MALVPQRVPHEAQLCASWGTIFTTPGGVCVRKPQHHRPSWRTHMPLMKQKTAPLESNTEVQALL
ncbi:MAG: hypothetical protein RSE51_00330 [Bacteroidales bacterium]